MFRNLDDPSIEKMATNYFDLLPDELLVKIFKDTFRYYEGSVFKYYENRDENNYTHTAIKNLYSTCKRFYRIINDFVLADIEFVRLATFSVDGAVFEQHAELPTLFYRSLKMPDFNVKNKPPSWCDYSDEDGCNCREYRELLALCKLKYRYLSLNGINLSRNCIPKLIQDNLANLDWIVQLTLDRCVLSSVALDKILTCLPKIERLCIRYPPEPGALQGDQSSGRGMLRDDSPVRTLRYLQLDLHDCPDPDLADQFKQLPAKIIDGNFCEEDPEATLSFIRKYLLRHKTIVEHFRFRLYGQESIRLEYFEGFDVTSTFDGVNFEVTSLPCCHLDLDKMMIIEQRKPSEVLFQSEDSYDSSDDYNGDDYYDDHYDDYDPNLSDPYDDPYYDPHDPSYRPIPHNEDIWD